MKKLLVFIFSLFFAFSVNAKCITNDAWTGVDKNKHFVVGAAVGSSVTLVTKKPNYGVLTGAVVALAKEAYDAQGHGTCSMQDAAVTILGAAAGAYGTAWIILPKKDGVFVGYSTRY